MPDGTAPSHYRVMAKRLPAGVARLDVIPTIMPTVLCGFLTIKETGPDEALAARQEGVVSRRSSINDGFVTTDCLTDRRCHPVGRRCTLMTSASQRGHRRADHRGGRRGMDARSGPVARVSVSRDRGSSCRRHDLMREIKHRRPGSRSGPATSRQSGRHCDAANPEQATKQCPIGQTIVLAIDWLAGHQGWFGRQGLNRRDLRDSGYWRDRLCCRGCRDRHGRCCNRRNRTNRAADDSRRGSGRSGARTSGRFSLRFGLNWRQRIGDRRRFGRPVRQRVCGICRQSHHRRPQSLRQRRGCRRCRWCCRRGNRRIDRHYDR